MKKKPRLRYNILISLFAVVAFMLAAMVPAGASAKETELHTARYYASRAQQYENNNSWEAAKREIDEGLELYPDDPQLRYLNGRYYYHAQKDLQQARYNLIKALHEDDQHFLARRLLVDVEEDAGHNSSAICYINELLEFEPYNRDLWRRKISLYNKTGHTVEADEALERLARIYPNDSIVQQDLALRNRLNWNQILQSNSMSEAAANLEHFIDHDPTNMDYYYRIIDLYRKLGENERALGFVNLGLYYSPYNQELIELGVRVLTGMGEYVRALTFLRENRVGGALYNRVLQDVAYDDRIRDPYEANGQLFARTKNREALQYMLNTSITRGYYDDARYYLNEAMKIYGVTPQLLMKEYNLEKRFGSEETQHRLLLQLYALNPSDEDIRNDYCDLMLELANRDVQAEEWSDALTHLRRALEILEPDDPQWPAAMARQITIMGHLGMMREAQWVYEHASKQRPDMRARFASAYEDVAATRLKEMIESEQYARAYEEAQSLLKILPDSETALRACVNLSQTLKKTSDFWHYAALGYEKYPDNPYFIVKQAIALQEQGQVKEALDLLATTESDDMFQQSQLSTAYQGIALDEVNMLLEQKRAEDAMMLIDSALLHNPDNKELLYAKGRAYELLKDYALAYEYQSKNYNPSNAEQSEWEQHMRYLRFRGFKNRIDASYSYAMYDTRSGDVGSVAHMYSIANVTYARLSGKNTYTGWVSYKGIDGYLVDNFWESGGMGLEVGFQWDRTINTRWAIMLSGSWSNQFFNKFGANFGASYYAGRGWTIGGRLAYRRTPPSVYVFVGDEAVMQENREYNLFIFSPWTEKSWERIKMTMGVDLSMLHRNFYWNANWKGKLFINEDNISSVSIMASFGTFPELAFYDQAAINSSARNNATLGVEGQILLTKNMYFGISGVWNTFYNPQKTDYGILRTYRNVYVLTGQLHVAF